MAKGENAGTPRAKEMTVDELKRELKKFTKRVNQLERLDEDPELKELLEPGIDGLGLTDLLAMVGFVKLMFLFARYFDIPPEYLEFKRKGGAK